VHEGRAKAQQRKEGTSEGTKAMRVSAALSGNTLTVRTDTQLEQDSEVECFKSI
jgi:hypothetical protein